MINEFSNRKFIGIPIILFLIITVTAGYILDKTIFNILLTTNQTRMVEIASGLSEFFEHAKQEITGEEIRSIVEHFNGIADDRVTLIAQDGAVIEDSAVAPGKASLMKNHGQRGEVVAALSGVTGIQTRVSTVTKVEMMYVAIPSTLNNQPIAIRISIPTGQIHRLMVPMMVQLSGLAAATLLSLAAVAFVIVRRMNRRIRSDYVQLEDLVDERTQEISKLQQLGTLLSACGNQNEIMDVTHALLPQILPNTSGAIAMFNASRNQLEVMIEWGKPWAGPALYNAGECWSLRTGREHHNHGGKNGVICKHLEGISEDQWCFPMLAHGDTLGALHLITADGTLSTNLKNLVFAISEQVGLAIANQNLRRSLSEQATRDALTGLYNRRFLMDTFPIEISRAEREGKILGVMMMDLDHFKKFNDTYGHACGDEVLSKLGAVIRRCTRGHDLCCRYGGEEFAIILQESSVEGVSHIAERICQTVREMEIIHAGQTIANLSISIGISIYPAHGNTPDELLKQADSVLYQVKENGRDGFQIAEIPEEAQPIDKHPETGGT